MSNDEDYYKILEINKSASQDEIKRSYKKLAVKWHPDKNKSSEATSMFKKISEAYTTLSDPEKRNIYDKYGKDGLKNNGMQFDPGNIFEMFNGMFGRNMFNENMHVKFNNNEQQINTNIEITEQIHLKDVFTGKNINKQIDRTDVCNVCNGTGSDDGKDHVCQTCKGACIIKKQTINGPIISIQQMPCPTCHGKGMNLGEHACKKCSGNKVIIEHKNINIMMPAGCIENDHIIIENEGNIDPKTKKRGKIIININILQDEQFIRKAMINNQIKIDDHNLLMKMNISLEESICGFKKSIQHVDGHKVLFDISDIIKNNDIYIIKNEGLPFKEKTKHGDLFVIFIVDYPTNISNEKKEKIWKILNDQPYETILSNKNISNLNIDSEQNKQEPSQQYEQCTQQ